MTEVSIPPGFTIDLNDAVKVTLRQFRMLTPVEFRTPDGRSGWVVQFPGGHPLATPAYANGRLFLGGGYGSYDFYALDAESGSILWKIKTSDDGPTAAEEQEDGASLGADHGPCPAVRGARHGRAALGTANQRRRHHRAGDRRWGPIERGQIYLLHGYDHGHGVRA